MRLKRLSVVIPTFNEEPNIHRLVSEIDKALKQIPYEIIFVDDSTDDTPKVIEAEMAANQHIRLEHREHGDGLSGAVIRGFALATGDYLAVMDADLQHPPAVLLDMYCAMRRKADICIPSRFIPGGSDGGLDIIRKTISAVARYAGKILLPSLRKISDPTGGLFMFRREILEGAELTAIGWKILVEVLGPCRYSRITEIPYAFADRNAGETKLSLSVSMDYLKQLAGLIKRGTVNDVWVERWTTARVEKERELLSNILDGGYDYE